MYRCILPTSALLAAVCGLVRLRCDDGLRRRCGPDRGRSPPSGTETPVDDGSPEPQISAVRGVNMGSGSGTGASIGARNCRNRSRACPAAWSAEQQSPEVTEFATAEVGNSRKWIDRFLIRLARLPDPQGSEVAELASSAVPNYGRRNQTTGGVGP
jgi:hypothetical protein